MTRLFREGRTETVRPCTVEAASWAIAMDNANVSVNRVQGGAENPHLGYLIIYI